MISGDTQTAAFSFFWIFPAWPGLLQLKASVSAQEIDNALAKGAEAAQGAPLLDAMSSSVHASSVALPWVRYTLLTRSFCVIWQRAMRPTLQSTRRRRPLWVTQGEFLITHLCRPCVFWLACFKFDSAELMARRHVRCRWVQSWAAPMREAGLEARDVELRNQARFVQLYGR